MKTMPPFNVSFAFPTGMRKLPGAALHFLLNSTEIHPDVSENYPQNVDFLPINYSECEQLIKFTSSTVALNNVIYIATKMLTHKIEDLATPLSRERRAERILCAVVREASALVADITIKANLLSSALLRRDNMTRCDKNPRLNPVTFGSPVPTTFTFNKFLGSYLTRYKILTNSNEILHVLNLRLLQTYVSDEQSCQE